MPSQNDLEFQKFDSDGKVKVSLASANLDGSKVNVDDMVTMLRSILIAIANPSYVDKSANAIRNQVQSGTITTVGTVTTIGTFNSWAGDPITRMINLNTWANSCRSLIT